MNCHFCYHEFMLPCIQELLLIKSFNFYNSSVECHSKLTNESLIRFTNLFTRHCIKYARVGAFTDPYFPVYSPKFYPVTESVKSGKCKDTKRLLLKTRCFIKLPFLPSHLEGFTQKRKIFGITCI